MKLGIVGKGGVGKTTVAALLAEAFAHRGQRVLAIDTDSNPNLGVSLGLSPEEAENLVPIPRSAVVGEQSTTTPAELVEVYGRNTPSGATLLSAMKVTQAGAGCTCGSHAAVRSLLGSAIDDEADVTIVDMEAGLEHLSRSGGTLAFTDALFIVMEPNRKSVVTAVRTLELARELGIPRVYGLGNKARLPADAEFFREVCQHNEVPLAGVIPLEPDVAEADRYGRPIGSNRAGAARAAIEDLVDMVDRMVAA